MEPNANTLANHVAGKLRRLLISWGLSEGDVFMKEADVSQRYQVSRGIAREAVSQLRALGILKSRQARGLLVGRSDPVELLAQSLPFYNRSAADLEQVGKFRYVLEVGAIELAVRHATDEQIRRLRDLVEQYERTPAPQLSGVDLAFHRLLLEMTNEPLVAGMHGVLSDYFYAESEQLPAADPDDRSSQWQHRAIAEAVAMRDTEQCRALLRQHLHRLVSPDRAAADQKKP